MPKLDRFSFCIYHVPTITFSYTPPSRITLMVQEISSKVPLSKRSYILGNI